MGQRVCNLLCYGEMLWALVQEAVEATAEEPQPKDVRPVVGVTSGAASMSLRQVPSP